MAEASCLISSSPGNWETPRDLDVSQKTKDANAMMMTMAMRRRMIVMEEEDDKGKEVMIALRSNLRQATRVEPCLVPVWSALGRV